MRRVGIFGGSFNPVHLGHVLVARAAKEALKLDEIIFVPCCHSADRKKILPAPARLRMLRTALKGHQGFSASDIEIRRRGVSRTIDTLFELKAHEKKGTQFFVLIGEDQAAKFPLWKDAEKISRLSKVCVMARPGFRKNRLIHRKFRFQTLFVPQYEISSTEIRLRLKKNLPIISLVDPKNLSYLKSCRNIL